MAATKRGEFSDSEIGWIGSATGVLADDRVATSDRRDDDRREQRLVRSADNGSDKVRREGYT